jgi:hypothetical protein
MSLKDELLASNKLSLHFRMAVERVPENTDPDQPLFEGILRTKGSDSTPLDLPGLKENVIAGPIRTAREISLNGLKALVDSDRVVYIEASRRLYPSSQGPV